MKRIFRVLKYCIKFFISYIFAFFIKIFCRSKRNIWLISERGTDARDNGYFFYKYLKEKHPEQIVFYIIKKSSVDAKKIATEDIIEPDTFKHFVYFALSRVRISTHAWGGDIPFNDYYKKSGFFKHSRKVFIFLKHGIIKDFLPQHCYGEEYPNIYVCGAKPEYDYVKEKFGYPKGVVQYLGLARFDNLLNTKVKNQILFMPTFRKWLQKLTPEDFKKEEYYKFWQNVIASPDIIKLLEENDINLIFYPHYEMQPYINLFKTDCHRIIIADFDHFDVQTLLKESKLLVTDFSSVFFDFGYMQKPVIYYQFDREHYIKGHYDFTKGYFSYDDNGFGDVAFDENQLIYSIKKIISNNFILEQKYKNRIDEFFPLKDSENCNRIYRSIINLTNN